MWIRRCSRKGSDSEYWLLNTTLAEPTKEVLQEAHYSTNLNLK